MSIAIDSERVVKAARNQGHSGAAQPSGTPPHPRWLQSVFPVPEAELPSATLPPRPNSTLLCDCCREMQAAGNHSYWRTSKARTLENIWDQPAACISKTKLSSDTSAPRPCIPPLRNSCRVQSPRSHHLNGLPAETFTIQLLE